MGVGGSRGWQGPTSTHCLLGTDGGNVTCYFDVSFLPFSFDFFSFLFSLFFPLSPFCSRDAAKRKAWKLNRVGSLRNIYSSSSTNTEGNAAAPPPGLTSAPRHAAVEMQPQRRMHPCCVCRPVPVAPPSLCLCVSVYHSCSFQLT